jgi:hypothetical protein
MEQLSPNLVTVRTFRDLPAAMVAKSVLEAAEIPCFLADANTIRIDWLLSNAIGGIKLRVREDDAAEANEILNQEMPEAPEPDEGESNQ